MNIVIPQNFKEAQQLLHYLASLDNAEFDHIQKLYQIQGIDIHSYKPGEVILLFVKNDTKIVFTTFLIKWYKKTSFGDLPHREDGPAIEYANGAKEWYQNGKRHRTDGPAVEYASGDKEWWLNNERIESIIERFVRATLFDIKHLIKQAFHVFKIEGIFLDSESEVKSFIEFLWQNGYQFNEYLNDYKVEESLQNEHEVEMARISPRKEERIMNALRDFYIADKVSKIIERLYNSPKEEIPEFMRNIQLVQRKPKVEEIFKNWEAYDEFDELSEAMSIKNYWTYI